MICEVFNHIAHKDEPWSTSNRNSIWLTTLAGDYNVEQKVTILYLMRDFVNGECPLVEVIAVINAGKTDSGVYSRLIWRKVTRQNALELT